MIYPRLINLYKSKGVEVEDAIVPLRRRLRATIGFGQI